MRLISQAIPYDLVAINVQRRATQDDENLRDAPAMERLLKQYLNLLLHGHTHESGFGLWDTNVPILGTGSGEGRRV